MNQQPCIEQQGIVREITNGNAKVEFMKFSACSSCEAKGACNIVESTEEMINVPMHEDKLEVGDKVFINMQRSLGLKAVLLAYVLPFVLLFITVIVLIQIGIHEGIAGLIGLLSLVLYYIVLAKQKKYLNKTFTFSIRKAF